MRSTIAGLAGILYFILANAAVRRFFPVQVASEGLPRQGMFVIVMGGSLLVFCLVYLNYWKLFRRRPYRSRRRGRP